MNEDAGMVPLPPDLAQCAQEPIRIPGSIQPHGVLLILEPAGLTIVSASESTALHLGIAATACIGQPLAAALGDQTSRLVGDSLRHAIGHATCLLHGKAWIAVGHEQDGRILLELEELVPAHQGAPSTLMLATAATRRLQAANTLEQACEIAAEEVRRITCFDRVKLYRFAPDWGGQVLGEARDPAMDSYLGLHFPASDIPAQARELYRSNPLRLIADASYTPSPLVPAFDPDTGAPFDLGKVALRSVSPIHLEYLRNMQVGASMSVSILKNGLWGLIACHHRTPMHVGLEARQACELVAQVLAWQLAAMDRVETAARSGSIKALHASLLGEAGSGRTTAEGLGRQGRAVLDLVDATGFALVAQDGVLRVGAAPAEAFIRGLAHHLGEAEQPEILATDRLKLFYPEAESYAHEAAGMIAVPLPGPRGDFLFWFRAELPQTVTWAGEPAKAVRQEGGERKLHPRYSFAAWTEQVRGQSAPWSPANLAAAMQARELVTELIIGERQKLERQNLRLAKSHQELETFIYVASHDIREPLRQMEMLVSMLRGCVAAGSAVEADAHLADFTRLGTRLRRLTEELADYAKLSRSEHDFADVDLNSVVDEVLAQLAVAIEQAGAAVEKGNLPAVRGERTQLHQVFLNLIGNALKYREPSRKLLITIRDVSGAIGPGAASAGVVRVEVQDNGIGLDAKHAERVFEPFVRLHSKDRYEGSGLGLTICRRIAERHGGRMEATGKPNRGTKFTLILPDTLSIAQG